jgi:hypothetical protein
MFSSLVGRCMDLPSPTVFLHPNGLIRSPPREGRLFGAQVRAKVGFGTFRPLDRQVELGTADMRKDVVLILRINRKVEACGWAGPCSSARPRMGGTDPDRGHAAPGTSSGRKSATSPACNRPEARLRAPRACRASNRMQGQINFILDRQVHDGHALHLPTCRHPPRASSQAPTRARRQSRSRGPRGGSGPQYPRVPTRPSILR